jgi:hypothetical protein
MGPMRSSFVRLMAYQFTTKFLPGSGEINGISIYNQARLTPEFSIGGLPEMKVYLGGMSILSILLSIEPGCHNPPPLEDLVLISQPQDRNVPSWPRPYVQYWHTHVVHPVSSIRTIPCPSQRTHALCVRTHVLDPYATVSFSTDSYAPMKL